MRLTKLQQQIICATARRFFGEQTQIWLFGSRIDDQKRGGDIDLYIEPECQEIALLPLAKLEFLRALHCAFGEQKIDVVLRVPHLPLRVIDQIAKQTGIKLNDAPDNS